MGRVCDVMEILQSRLATATSRPPARDIRDTVNPPRGFDQSVMLTSYRVWDYPNFLILRVIIVRPYFDYIWRSRVKDKKNVSDFILSNIFIPHLSSLVSPLRIFLFQG